MNDEKLTLNYNDIIKLIPHRYPFLLIDKVKDIIKNDKAIGVKHITINEEFFIGHFPSYPIMPGVLIIEAMAQTAACLVSYSNQNLQGEKVVFLTGVENAKFKKTVNPGCELYLEVKLLSFRRNFFKFSGKAFSDDDLMATSNFSAMLSVEGK